MIFVFIDYWFKKKHVCILFLFSYLNLFSQVDSSYYLIFDFNEHAIKEKDSKVVPKSVGVTLTDDRFGNKHSAIYIHGHVTSYLNLGVSSLLKPKNGTISLWVNLERRVRSGRGYDYNPIFGTKNRNGDDFNNAYAISYECYNGRFGSNTTKDSTREASIYSIDTVKFNTWYHLVITNNFNEFSFYVNGQLQKRIPKSFETIFSTKDSVMLGHSASEKNERFTQGIFDDIKIFHKVLSEEEILKLYNEPDPNKLSSVIDEIVKFGIIIIVLIIIIIFIIIRNKRNLRLQKEQFELINKITELELKVVKSQMNPHFISNCLVAIQDLIYNNKNEKAVQYIAKFSFFLRQVLNYSDKNYITIAEEIEIINLNIELEQLRFKNNFDFQISISEKINTEEVLIPSLITQPFIENAIWHGLLPLKGLRNPQLKINIFLKGTYAIIEIEDNGVGRKLNENRKKESKGTKLVEDKISSLNRLFKTSNYRMEIIDLFDGNKLQVGTKVRIQLDNI